MTRSGGKFVGLLVALALAIGLNGCKQQGGSAADADEIIIGEYASLTGTTATFGVSTHNGVLLAIEEANAAGGINGKKIKLITEDDRSKADEARVVVTKLVTQNKAVAVLGEVASTRSMTAAPVCQQYKVPMVSPSSTNPEVTRKGDYIFRVCFTDDFQAAVVGKFAYDKGYRKAAIFKDMKNDYSVAFADNFAKSFIKQGGKVVGEQSYQEGDTDFKSQLNSLKAAGPDAILCPGYYSEVGTIARQAREIGLNVPILGGDGWDSPKLVPGAGTALNGCFFSNHRFSRELELPEIKAFIANFKKKYNENPDALAALGYDAAGLVVDAMKRATKLDGPGIRDAIAQTKGYKGVTGVITLDQNRNARKEALILRIDGEVFRVEKTYRPEELGQ
jgi:branched-chain amino acid transport system substrate-binding protein